VIDSDIEEKKEIEFKKGSKTKSGNFLTVDFPKARSISSQPSQQKKKIIVEETKSEKSSQISDDIFYTCP
jgi:ssDNA-binding Zn-finger/Zn-ribbon topoisomerase 1